MDGDARELLGARGLREFEAAPVKLGVHAVGELLFVRREDLEGIGMSVVQVRKFEAVRVGRRS